MSTFSDIKNKGLELVYFTTTWCPDCTMMIPVIEEFIKWTKDNKIDVNVVHIDADEHSLYKTNIDWDVKKVGSFFILKDGERHHLGYEYLPVDVFKNKILELKK